MPQQQGWAFLVARGRYRGYRSILVPDFLARSNEYGLVTESVRGDVDPAGAPRVHRVTAPAAGPLTLVYRTRRMTHADLGDGHPTDAPPADQHGRPLDLLYGFVSRAAVVHEVDEADLRSAQEEALHAYRRFLADENGTSVQTSSAFPLRSSTRPERPAPRTTGTRPAARPHPLPWAAIIGVPAMAVVVLAALLLLRPLLSRPGIEVPTTAQCQLDAASHSCTVQVTVRSTGPARLSYAGASITQPPGTGTALWTLDDTACRAATDAQNCPITVTVTAPHGAVGQKLTATLTINLSDPGRTATVALSATG